FASCLESEAARVRDAFTAVVDEFASAGPTGEEIASDHEAYRRAAEDPDAILNELDRACLAHLTGTPYEPWPSVLAEIQAMGSEEIRDAFAAAIADSVF